MTNNPNNKFIFNKLVKSILITHLEDFRRKKKIFQIAIIALHMNKHYWGLNIQSDKRMIKGNLATIRKIANVRFVKKDFQATLQWEAILNKCIHMLLHNIANRKPKIINTIK